MTVTEREYFQVQFDGLLARVADMQERNAADHQLVRESLAQLRDEVASRDEKIDARLKAIEGRIAYWAGGLVIVAGVVGELLRRGVFTK